MRLHPVFSGAAVLLGLAHAATAEPTYVLDDSVTIPAPMPDHAVLVIAREEYARLRRMPADDLMLDGRPLGLLPQHAFVVASVEPGVHCLSGVPEASGLHFEVRDAQTCLLRLRETVNEVDQVVADWIFDDALSVRELILTHHLKRAITTATGAGKLEHLARVRPGDCTQPGTVDATARPDTSFAQVWYENPLDHVNVKHDFEDNPGTLQVTADGLHYEAKGVSVAIRVGTLRRVRFGGTRYTGISPWVDVDWSSPDGMGRVSFADSRTAQSVQTYDRMFQAIAELLSRTTSPTGADTLYNAPTR